MKNVCFFGIYDPKHWRIRSAMSAFKNKGYKVVECRVNPREVGGFRKYVELYRIYKSKKIRFNFVFVGFPGYLAVLTARLVSRDPIIFDAYISYFDGIRDRRDYSLLHPIMWLAWLIDVVGGLSADLVLTINEAYRDFFVRTLLVPESKIAVLHKGADEKMFYPRPNIKSGMVQVVGWWGSFIPLHGLPVIVEAAKILQEEKNISLKLIGGGQLASLIKKQVESYHLQNVEMIPYVPQETLAENIAKFDIVLGIFADTPKAGRCVTNKVYEAIAMGKAVITEDSKANREIFTHMTNAYLVPAGDPQALSDAILQLCRDRQLRERLGGNARKLFEERFTIEKIEEELAGIISRHYEF